MEAGLGVPAFVQMIVAAVFGSGAVAAWMSRRRTAAETEKASAEADLHEAEAAGRWVDLARDAWADVVKLRAELAVMRASHETEIREAKAAQRHRWRLASGLLRKCANGDPAIRQEIEALFRSIDMEERADQAGDSDVES